MKNSEYELEEGLNRMIDDLSLVDDEFVNNYFEDESKLKDEPIFDYLEDEYLDNISENFSESVLEIEKDEKKDILNEIDDYFKLSDTKEVIREEEKILKIIDNSKNGHEFFEQFEKGILND